MCDSCGYDPCLGSEPDNATQPADDHRSAAEWWDYLQAMRSDNNAAGET